MARKKDKGGRGKGAKSASSGSEVKLPLQAVVVAESFDIQFAPITSDIPRVRFFSLFEVFRVF
jgi:hypothetical protein